MSKYSIAVTLIAFAGSIGMLGQARADDRAGRSLVATCAACHKTEGNGSQSTAPDLSRIGREAALRALQEFRDGRKPATVMHQLAKGYSPDQLEEIATYLETIRKRDK